MKAELLRKIEALREKREKAQREITKSFEQGKDFLAKRKKRDELGIKRKYQHPITHQPIDSKEYHRLKRDYLRGKSTEWI